jgi:hypothetical protein
MEITEVLRKENAAAISSGYTDDAGVRYNYFLG